MKIIEQLKKLFVFSKVYICDKCGWQTNMTKGTEKLKKYCKECAPKNDNT